MLVIAWIIGAVFGLGIGGMIAARTKKKCNHKWVLFKSTTINNFRNGQEVQVGYVKFYECEHCKKMKNEKVEI